jgi:hypothetical protein
VARQQDVGCRESEENAVFHGRGDWTGGQELV